MATFGITNATSIAAIDWTLTSTPPSTFGYSSTVTAAGPPTHLTGILQQLLVVIGSSLSLVFIAFAFITFTLFSDLKD